MSNYRNILFLLISFVLFSQFVFAGRYYDSRTGRFLQIDPKAQKYPNLSPYAYCADNPLKYIDPDGKVIKLANGSSPAFQKQFAAAVKYLNAHHVGGKLAGLQKSETVFYIKEGQSSNYDFKSRTINWNPTMGVLTNKGVMMSPTTGLNHEADHALQRDQNSDQYKKDIKTPDAQYDNKEEKRVITGSEQTTARALGEIKEGEVTREDHGGTPTTTMGPTSTDPDPAKSPYTITVTPEKEKKDENK